MPDDITTAAQDNYKTRIEISRDGQNTLYAEQARRMLKGERINLVELASELVEATLVQLKKEHDANPVG
jgi:16S rRNA U1498 N3-methylase RsmE